MQEIKTIKQATLYVGKYEEKNIKFTRVWAMPNHETFKIRPIAVLLKKYVGNGRAWIDPFAGNNSPAEYTNDHNPKTSAKSHLDALDFCNKLKGNAYKGVIYDPPYSFTQIKEHYQVIGKKVEEKDHRMGFYEKPKSVLCEKIRVGGMAISFGWNTNGFGKARGFEIIEIMAVAHGGSKNDTLVVVERKIR
jgi:hypothetical protein